MTVFLVMFGDRVALFLEKNAHGCWQMMVGDMPFTLSKPPYESIGLIIEGLNHVESIFCCLNHPTCQAMQILIWELKAKQRGFWDSLQCTM